MKGEIVFRRKKQRVPSVWFYPWVCLAGGSDELNRISGEDVTPVYSVSLFKLKGLGRMRISQPKKCFVYKVWWGIDAYWKCDGCKKCMTFAMSLHD